MRPTILLYALGCVRSSVSSIWISRFYSDVYKVSVPMKKANNTSKTCVIPIQTTKKYRYIQEKLPWRGVFPGVQANVKLLSILNVTHWSYIYIYIYMCHSGVTSLTFD